jgi:hypothetical protein
MNDYEPVGRSNPMDTHVTIVGGLHIAFGLLGLMGMAFAMIFVVGAGVAMAEAGHGLFGTLIGTIALAFLAVLSLPGLIGGIGLLMRKNWGRILVIIVSFVQLINIPFGTVLGAYSLWVLLQEDTRRLLVERLS